MIPVTDAIALDERDIEESFIRASGPGGQNVNKVASAVQLRFNLRGSRPLSELDAEFAGEGGRLLLGREIDLNDDGAVDMLIANDRRLETAAVEPLAHPRHLEDEIAVAYADLGAVKVHPRHPVWKNPSD